MEMETIVWSAKAASASYRRLPTRGRNQSGPANGSFSTRGLGTPGIQGLFSKTWAFLVTVYIAWRYPMLVGLGGKMGS